MTLEIERENRIQDLLNKQNRNDFDFDVTTPLLAFASVIVFQMLVGKLYRKF